MNKQQRSIAGAAAALGLTVLASGANATQGYFQAGFDAVQKSFAGGGVADSETATSIAINPAGLFDVGQQANIGLTFLTVWPEYSAIDTGFITPAPRTATRTSIRSRSPPTASRSTPTTPLASPSTAMAASARPTTSITPTRRAAACSAAG